MIDFIGDARHAWRPGPGLDPTAPGGRRRRPRSGGARNLSDPVQAEELIGRVNLRTLTVSVREYGGEIVHRLAVLLFTLLTLFFFFRDGGALTEQLRRLSDRLIGVRGERIARHMIAAVHGTVNGLVLVGLAEGILLGLVYFAVGLPYPASVGALTGVAAVIPFAAPVVYTSPVSTCLAVGNMFGGIVILVFGSVLLFVADHFVRPYLIGGAARVPFPAGLARHPRRAADDGLSRAVSRAGGDGGAGRAMARMDRAGAGRPAGARGIGAGVGRGTACGSLGRPARRRNA